MLRQSRFLSLLCLLALAVFTLTGRAEEKPVKPDPIVKGAKVDGMHQGPVEIWSTPSTRQAAGHYRNGRPDGRWTFWNEEGIKLVEITYVSGTFTGAVTMWHGGGVDPRDKGKLKLRGSFMEGDWQGSILTYYPNGRMRSERVYEGGVIVDAYARSPNGQNLPPEQAKKIAAEDEQIDNAFVDALDEFIRRWAGEPAA